MQALFFWVSKNLCAISIWKIRPRKWTSILSVLASMETLLSEYYYWIFKEFSHICEMDMLLNLMYWYFYFLFSLVERNKCIVVSIPDPSFGSALPALFLELELHLYLHNYSMSFMLSLALWSFIKILRVILCPYFAFLIAWFVKVLAGYQIELQKWQMGHNFHL